MSYSNIDKSTNFFNTKLYTGNGSYGNSITGVGFQPDFIWIKNRDTTHSHRLSDAVRGTDKTLSSDNNSAELSSVNLVHSFDSDGFTVDDDSAMNGNGNNIVAWNWKANGSSTVTNNDGATTSYISHNSTSQFSIIKYTGTGSNTNIGHGLNGKPDCFITKALSASDWHMWHNSFSANDRIKLNSTAAKSTNTSIFPTLPDATKIYFGSGGDVNGSGVEYICYAWKNVPGFSKFGVYSSNSNVDGGFIYTGFKVSFLLVTTYTTTGGWQMYDNKRNTSNPTGKYLRPDANNAEASGSNDIDFLSNGFKTRTTLNPGTTDGFLYMAFGQSLVGSNNVPCTAR